MRFNEKYWRVFAGLNGFAAIVMGAVAAHVIVDVHAASMAEKASTYHLIHAALLLWLAGQQGRCFALARWALFAGMVLFCGSLYLKSLTGWVEVTAVAPAGGMSFMAAWLLIAFAPRKSA